MAKYHISRAGQVVPCRAVKGPCRARPPEDLEQFHHGSVEEVYRHLSRQYNDVMRGVKFKRNPPPEVITDEIVGSPATDRSRLDKRQGFPGRWKTAHQVFLRDTEGRPMAFVHFNEDQQGGPLSLCDVEVRPEYRGRKLSHRLLKAVEEEFGKPLEHTGGYTLAGLKALAPLFHGEEDLTSGKVQDVFPPMTFVEDWDRAWAKYPL